MERTSFNDLGLIEPILKALETEGYTHPTPIQEQAIRTFDPRTRPAGLRTDRNR
jgi:superfamily II DNA/RNA helicase